MCTQNFPHFRQKYARISLPLFLHEESCYHRVDAPACHSWATFISTLKTYLFNSAFKARFSLPVITGRRYSLSAQPVNTIIIMEFGIWTPMFMSLAGHPYYPRRSVIMTHYPWTRAVLTARDSVYRAFVFTVRVDGPFSRVMWTGAREHGPQTPVSKMTAVLNTHVYGPWTRIVCTDPNEQPKAYHVTSSAPKNLQN